MTRASPPGPVPTGPAPHVTVLIVTHNHARFIAAAIESALEQITRFRIEILISEDASTDGTRDIVTRYAERHPHLIGLLLSEKNIRSNEVMARGLRAARGRYVAMLDGDDRWCDPARLQRQADFLDRHPECSAVFGNAVVAVGEALTEDRWTRSGTAPRLDLAALMEGNPFATCAGMMRTDCLRPVPDWYAGIYPITDWPLYALCALHGELAFVDEVVGVYRLHDGGAMSSRMRSDRLDAVEAFYRRLSSNAPRPLARAARRGAARYFFDWAKAHLAEGEVGLARSCFRRSLACGGLDLTVTPHERLRLGWRLARTSMTSR
jgi:glycosyltransferase involved in cell wall biosynthesis